MKKTLLVSLPIILFIAIISYVMSRGADAAQPIDYNHKKHIDEAGLSCADCHQYVDSHSKAGLPDLDQCLECHEEALTENSEEEKIQKFAAAGKQLNWRQIYIMSEDVYFSHRRHVAIAQIECETCHGKMQEMMKPPTRPAKNLSMDFCIDCHYEMNADNDCIACHR